MDKTSFLDSLKTERARWDALLAQVGEARMTVPGAEGEWSVKDIIAHVSWFEREMVDVLRAHALVGSELWNLPQDQRNTAVFEQNRDRALHDVLGESQRMFPQLLELVEALSDEDLNDPGRFAGMPNDWLPWKIIAGNTYTHYPDHGASIRAWLDRLDQG
jgi:hypothetical protein